MIVSRNAFKLQEDVKSLGKAARLHAYLAEYCMFLDIKHQQKILKG
jgi:hypothetical protein